MNKMKPINRSVLVIVCSFFTLLLIVGASEESVGSIGDAVVESIVPTIDDVSAATTKYLPVVFKSHDKHAKEYGLKCVDCHHEFKGKNDEEEPIACSSCHVGSESRIGLTDAMHKSCRGCHEKHKALKKESTAPVACLKCHTERK